MLIVGLVTIRRHHLCRLLNARIRHETTIVSSLFPFLVYIFDLNVKRDKIIWWCTSLVAESLDAIFEEIDIPRLRKRAIDIILFTTFSTTCVWHFAHRPSRYNHSTIYDTPSARQQSARG